jgi:NADPH:quinone reductase-like Zn-dependent oxidoreductase
MKMLSIGIKNKARRLGVDYSFLFMRADGNQLSVITKLINGGIIKPVIDKVFTFDQTNEALAYVEAGRSKGKVVIKVK